VGDRATIVLFGASGDLAGRLLLPALAALQAGRRLPNGFRLIGSATEDWDDVAFRQFAAERLEQHASELPAAARAALVSSLTYRRADLDRAEDVARAVAAADARGPIVAYLALPPSVFPQPLPRSPRPACRPAAGSRSRTRSAKTWTARWP
jgi:glucose-6-phosphate 1-dehydrogenase